MEIPFAAITLSVMKCATAAGLLSALLFLAAFNYGAPACSLTIFRLPHR